MALTLTDAQRLLLGIIASVESGVTTPEDAVTELAGLKEKATAAGLNFRADYTLQDFQDIRQKEIETYESDAYYYDDEVIESEIED